LPPPYAEWQKRLAKRSIDADALVGLVIGEAEVDLSQLCDVNGKILPPHEWPPSVAKCVESFDMREDGSIRVRLASQARARRFLLELAGRTRSTAASIDHLAEAILADRAKHRISAPTS
jgi:hypothetical protein